MKLINIPIDSVRITPESLYELRDAALEELREYVQVYGWMILGQHVVRSADGTTVWLTVLIEDVSGRARK